MAKKLTHRLIEKLEKYSLDFPVLSVCLSRERKDAPSGAGLLTLFHSLIHQKLNRYQEKDFKNDVEKMTKYITESYDGHGVKSLVFFSSGDKLWEVFVAEFYVPPFCVISPKPFLDPIKKAIESHERYLVLLVDREKARFFTVHFGEIEEQKEFLNLIVPQDIRASKAVASRTSKISRHIDWHLHRHLQDVVEATKSFMQGKDINFILIGGHKELIPMVKEHFTYPLKQKILGEFVTELNIPLNDVFLKSKEIAAGINSQG